ncbi:unnamed protein product [Rotaria magnacalcarata]
MQYLEHAIFYLKIYILYHEHSTTFVLPSISVLSYAVLNLFLIAQYSVDYLNQERKGEKKNKCLLNINITM